MDMARVWPIVCQFGVGGILCLVGIWCGISSGYLDLKRSAGRWMLAALVFGYVVLLAFSVVFTFWAPFWTEGGAS